jgi:hypothetical protein
MIRHALLVLAAGALVLFIVFLIWFWLQARGGVIV